MNSATAQVFRLPERDFQASVLELLHTGLYDAALMFLHTAREKDPRNIFLIAIERQIRRIQQLALEGEGTADERASMSAGLSTLLQRAWMDAHSRGLVLPSREITPEEEISERTPASVDVAPAVEERKVLPPVQKETKKAVAPPVAAPVEDTPRRRLAPWMIAAGIVVVIGGGITVMAMRHSGSPSATPSVAAATPPVQTAAQEPQKAEATPDVHPVVNTPPASTQSKKEEPPEQKPAQEVAAPAKVEPAPVTKDLAEAKIAEPAPAKTENTTPVATTPSPAQPVTEEVVAPFVPVQQEPRLVKFVTPAFPSALQQRGAVGEITARVLIGADGKPQKVRIVSSTNPLMNEAVAKALLNSEFEAGVMTSGPVTSWLNVPLKFK